MVGHGPQSRSQLSHTSFKHLRLILSGVRGRGPDELADLMPLKESRANFSVKKSTNARTSSLRNICPDVKGMRNPLLLLSRVRQMT
jgi:hypothetical protein